MAANRSISPLFVSEDEDESPNPSNSAIREAAAPDNRNAECPYSVDRTARDAVLLRKYGSLSAIEAETHRRQLALAGHYSEFQARLHRRRGLAKFSATRETIWNQRMKKNEDRIVEAKERIRELEMENGGMKRAKMEWNESLRRELEGLKDDERALEIWREYFELERDEWGLSGGEGDGIPKSGQAHGETQVEDREVGGDGNGE